MELILVRHGLPDRVDVAPDGGPADPGLAPEGWEQAEALGHWLANRSVAPSHVYTSPLQRAVDTAAPLVKHLDVQPEVREGLAEFDRGAAYYVPLEELRANNDPRLADLIRDWTSPEKTAERQQFRANVVDTISTIAATHATPDDIVTVVCHGGVINAYLSDVLGIDQLLFFQPYYTSISRVKVSADGRRTLRTINETPHLAIH